jgi:2-polyprenyl-3-methyl-5-hydroxy-6-metoxy-1,4-benzoquinol methylase
LHRSAESATSLRTFGLRPKNAIVCIAEEQFILTVSGTNFGKAAGDYGTFRAGFPESILDRHAGFNVGIPGQSVIDLGTGTGTLARGSALRGCQVIGVDPDQRMIVEAKKLDRQTKVSIRYVEAKAEMTGLDSAADPVAAGQCWHWFDQPRLAFEWRSRNVPAVPSGIE